MRSTIDPLLIPLVWVSIQQFFKLVWKTDYNDQSKQRLTPSLAHEKPEFLEARENAGDQVAVGFRFASDWLKGWSGFFHKVQ